MNKPRWLKTVNPLLTAAVCAMLASGLLRKQFPSRDMFLMFHQTCAGVVAASAALHLALNWNWVVATYFRRHPPR